MQACTETRRSKKKTKKACLCAHLASATVCVVVVRVNWVGEFSVSSLERRGQKEKETKHKATYVFLFTLAEKLGALLPNPSTFHPSGSAILFHLDTHTKQGPSEQTYLHVTAMPFFPPPNMVKVARKNKRVAPLTSPHGTHLLYCFIASHREAYSSSSYLYLPTHTYIVCIKTQSTFLIEHSLSSSCILLFHTFTPPLHTSVSNF